MLFWISGGWCPRDVAPHGRPHDSRRDHREHERNSAPGSPAAALQASHRALPVVGIETDEPTAIPIEVRRGPRATAAHAAHDAGAPRRRCCMTRVRSRSTPTSDIHVCNTSGTPGTWHRLLTDRAPTGAAAGNLVLLDTPFRLWDSRPGLPAPSRPTRARSPPTANAPSTRGHGTPPVPDTATALLATITVTETGTTGHLHLYAPARPARPRPSTGTTPTRPSPRSSRSGWVPAARSPSPPAARPPTPSSTSRDGSPDTLTLGAAARRA